MTHSSGNQMVDVRLLFEKARLSASMHVADIGCGRTGHIVFPAAVIVGDRGIVYAVDILKDVLVSISKRASGDGLSNIHTVWGNVEQENGLSIPKKSLDVAFVVNSLVQCENRPAVLEEVKRTLKPKARMVIVDWLKKGLPFGPKDTDYIDFDSIEHWAKKNGLAVQETFLIGPFHKGLVLFQHE